MDRRKSSLLSSGIPGKTRVIQEMPSPFNLQLNYDGCAAFGVGTNRHRILTPWRSNTFFFCFFFFLMRLCKECFQNVRARTVRLEIESVGDNAQSTYGTVLTAVNTTHKKNNDNKEY